MPEIRTVGQLVTAHDRLTGAHARMKAKASKAIERGAEAVSAVAGGALSGAVRGLGFATIPKTSVPTDLVLGAIALGAGVANLGDGMASDMLVAFGAGLVAPEVSRFTEKAITDYRAK